MWLGVPANTALNGDTSLRATLFCTGEQIWPLVNSCCVSSCLVRLRGGGPWGLPGRRLGATVVSPHLPTALVTYHQAPCPCQVSSHLTPAQATHLLAEDKDKQGNGTAAGSLTLG